MELIIIFFFQKKKIVVARSFSADGNLLQPTVSVNRTPSHVTFLEIARARNSVARDIGSMCKCASCHPCFMRLSGCAF